MTQGVEAHDSLPKSAVERNEPEIDSDETLLTLGASVAGDLLVSLLIWLAPVVILGGIGLAIAASGSTETTNIFGVTTTVYDDRRMWIGVVFLALAAACFFGRGTVRHLGSVIKGQAGLISIAFIGSSLYAFLISLAAVAVAAFALFMATIGMS